MDTSHRVRSSEVGRLQVACAGDYCLTRERERERERSCLACQCEGQTMLELKPSLMLCQLYWSRIFKCQRAPDHKSCLGSSCA
jgi:hypothetical protein